MTDEDDIARVTSNAGYHANNRDVVQHAVEAAVRLGIVQPVPAVSEQSLEAEKPSGWDCAKHGCYVEARRVKAQFMSAPDAVRRAEETEARIRAGDMTGFVEYPSQFEQSWREHGFIGQTVHATSDDVKRIARAMYLAGARASQPLPLTENNFTRPVLEEMERDFAKADEDLSAGADCINSWLIRQGLLLTRTLLYGSRFARSTPQEKNNG